MHLSIRIFKKWDAIGSISCLFESILMEWTQFVGIAKRFSPRCMCMCILIMWISLRDLFRFCSVGVFLFVCQSRIQISSMHTDTESNGKSQSASSSALWSMQLAFGIVFFHFCHISFMLSANQTNYSYKTKRFNITRLKWNNLSPLLVSGSQLNVSFLFLFLFSSCCHCCLLLCCLFFALFFLRLK